MAEPKKTQLNALHRELGGKMVEFGGYDMPVQFPTGVLKEHLHTRAACGLFDVSHMGQAFLLGPDHETTARALEETPPTIRSEFHRRSRIGAGARLVHAR